MRIIYSHINIKILHKNRNIPIVIFKKDFPGKKENRKREKITQYQQISTRHLSTKIQCFTGEINVKVNNKNVLMRYS